MTKHETGGFSGGCLCGAVRYQSQVVPVVSGHCHCVDCRKSSGTGHSSHMAVPIDAVAVSGTTTGFAKPADSGNVVTRYFCPTCGAPVFSLNASMPTMIFLRASTLDDLAVFTPQARVYVSRAAEWDHMDSALPAFREEPPGGANKIITKGGA